MIEFLEILDLPTVGPAPTAVGRLLPALSLEHVTYCGRRRMGAQPIKTWRLMKQSLRNKFGVEHHERQRQNQAKQMSFHKLKMYLIEKVIHHKKKNSCTISEEKVKSVVGTKESEGTRKVSESLIENHESLKEEQEKEKQNEIEKSEETKEEMSLMIFEEDKREEMKERCCDISLPLNLLSMRRIQSQFLNFLTTTCGTKPNHGMKAKEEGMGKELSIGLEDTSLSLSLNPFLLYHEFSFKELKLFLDLYASYVTLVRNVMVNPFTCDLAFVIDHMLKCSSPCAYFEKQILVSVARIKPSYHDLELLHDNLFLDLLVANFSSSCASMWSKIHIFFGSIVEIGYDERVSCFP
ncbi:hypothetical protein M9H77_21951 [Catharanthus roseus]|uniref:Uncharacterized protein n=1 Tax=Catharanthus roseus TaxID=4058 RepID=A0ACC0ARQ1_CATRO|nr:hypothetical protein M9H77_21951 [Catharanthus roseus]